MFEEVTYFGDGFCKYDGGIVQYGYDNTEKASDSVYSDRLYGWDSEKYNKACVEVWGNEGQCFYSDRRPEDVERFLRIVLDNKTIVLKRILRYENASNGYPYWRFDFNNK